MKKLVMTVAVLTCASIVTAQTVTSANVVGYNKLASPAAGTFDLMALAQFSDSSSSVDIQSLIDNLDSLNSAGLGSNMAGADKLYVWTGAGYATYAMFQDGASGPYWASDSEGGWTPGLEFLGVNSANVVIDLGGGFWYESGTDKTVGFTQVYTID